MIGDNAYINTFWLLTPFNKAEKGSDIHRYGYEVTYYRNYLHISYCCFRDAYCYYVSQLRIRIEMAFGLLTMRWQIFKKPLVGKLKNHRHTITAAMKLHNFCINERLAMNPSSIALSEIEPFPMNALRTSTGDNLPSTCSSGRQRLHTWNHPDYSLEEIADVVHENSDSVLREQIVQYLRSNDYRRLNNNIY